MNASPVSVATKPSHASPHRRATALPAVYEMRTLCTDAERDEAAALVQDRQRWLTRQDLRLAITTWIERSYHRRRRQRRLGKLTPIEYETINRSALIAA